MGSFDARLLPWISAPALVIEVGTERGGGSTATIGHWANEHGYRFVSIDVDPSQRGSLDGVEYVTALAEDYLADLTPECNLRFAYLDGFDWPYPESILSRRELEIYERMYEHLDLHLTAAASQQSHLDIARHLDRLMPAGTIVFDDTWFDQDQRTWDGKGGTAVPFLLDREWVLTNNANDPPHNAYVKVVKL